MKRVAVFCASTGDDRPDLVRASEALVDAVADRGLGIVYGGARVGLMGVVARRALARGVDIVGVLPRRLLSRELEQPDLSRIHLVDTMAERKALMEQEAAAFVALPGGIGTLEEIFEQWTAHYIGVHEKKVGFLDVGGFWEPLFAALVTMHARGTVRPEHLAIPRVEEDPGKLLDALLGA